MGELATLGEDNGELIGATYSTPWDAAMVRGCNCNGGDLRPATRLLSMRFYVGQNSSGIEFQGHLVKDPLSFHSCVRR